METLWSELLLGLQGLLADWLSGLQELLLNPKKRVSIAYLLSATLVALLWLYWRQNWSYSKTLGQLFKGRYWWSSSARLDYQLVLVNQIIMLLLKPLVVSKLVVATAVYYFMADWFVPISLGWSGASWALPLAYTMTLFLMDDASRYWVHRLMHRVPVLWAFHRLHHSAETLTPFTVLRTHPVEGLLFGLRGVLVQGLVTGVFVYLFGKQVSLWQILGANGFIFVFNLLGANLRHSHVPLSYGQRVEQWLISPAQHQLHHSVDKLHYDKNFGVVLAIWDRLGGTLLAHEQELTLRFGVRDGVGRHDNLPQAYWQPIQQAWMALAASIGRIGRVFRNYWLQKSKL